MIGEKVVDLLVSNPSLTNQCLKVGNNGSVFGKMLEVVRFCCLYTIKKTQKELYRLMDASSSKTPFGLSHLSQGDEDDLNERDFDLTKKKYVDSGIDLELPCTIRLSWLHTEIVIWFLADFLPCLSL